MNNINGMYRNPRHDEIAAAIRNGFSDMAAAKLLGVDRKAVARVRKAEGVPPHTSSLAPAQAWMQFASTDDEGHTRWSGTTDYRGAPVLRQDGRYVTASHFAFETFHGRKPTGYLKADCGVQHCLTPSHMLDELGRRNLNLQLRALQGLGAPWTECGRCGADWDTAGRVDPDLKLYCNQCKTNRKKASA